MENKKIAKEALQAGDVLLFSPVEGDWESQLIALLTHATVSHAAMVYYTSEEIIEEIPEYAQINHLTERIAGRDISVMRLITDDKAEKKTQVVDVADKYAQQKLPYAMAALPCIGVYILTQNIVNTLQLQHLITKLMKLGMEALIMFIYRKDKGQVLPMVCSQFVYHCYNEAGEQYRIQLKDTKEIEGTLLYKVLDYVKGHKEELKASLQERPLKNYFKTAKGIEEQNVNKLYQNIYEEVKKAENEIFMGSQVTLDKEFMTTVYQFVSLIIEAILPKEEQYQIEESIEKTFELLNEFFVTPADLLEHTVNLEYMGQLTV